MQFIFMENKIQEANMIFQRVNERLSNMHKGKIIAIEVESGDYFIGDSELDAYKKAKEKYPNKKFVFKRIGFASTHFVGALG